MPSGESGLRGITALMQLLLITLFFVLESRAEVAPAHQDAADQSARVFLEQVEGKAKAAGTEGVFSTRACPKLSPADWARVLILDQPARLDLKFAPDCDLEGVVTVKKSGFPLDLKLRHVVGTDHARGRVIPKVALDLMDSRIDVEVALSDGVLSRVGANDYLKFRGSYSLVLGAELGGGQPISVRQNRGGKIAVTQYLSKPTHSEVPFKIE